MFCNATRGMSVLHFVIMVRILVQNCNSANTLQLIPIYAIDFTIREGFIDAYGIYAS